MTVSAGNWLEGSTGSALWVRLIQTRADMAPVILRLFLGVVILPHGLQKTLGWYGGYGFGASMDFFTQQMGIPAVFAFLAIFAESFGALALLVGFLTRLAAAGIGVVMLVAVGMVHFQYGFFMNWFGNQAGEGFEYHLLVLAMALVLVVTGGGRWSVDRRISGL